MFLTLVYADIERRWNTGRFGKEFVEFSQFTQRILRDLERERKAIKHGATLVRVPLSEKNAPMEEYTFDFLAFDMALEALEKLDMEYPKPDLAKFALE